MSSVFFYADRVFKGLDAKQTVELGLSSSKTIVCQSIDSLLQDPSLINKQLKDLPGQYYLLKTHFKITATLKKWRLGSNVFQNNKIAETRDT
jgi:hypothetical protein